MQSIQSIQYTANSYDKDFIFYSWLIICNGPIFFSLKIFYKNIIIILCKIYFLYQNNNVTTCIKYKNIIVYL
ncbi:hypothetical protein GLOIN_2v532712 [Rhizophagus irregularis DAOM 181602=DAOM 197198]|uniref:Uncharacterized protein n=1 Tax=Rhizophagus irregularis (strain DAOM 181602 / DAOM 197198 / MUCL 43194) TaxID=747089 RepID=A0A2P4QNN8_RHIID|nr:hypothetical protein GLOIN_2v532712 [Rhizophagus irregularis DAOM 181602=DAOM 197198]POG79242.1 hypothetical protein GLOIN_2v532712 [Rhizophagus irregularis DAOM 181602=DAOM 197198]|eukprot:XP_025186108.1 hypothetical protein GLOIN_2v532712 [Rhizophagus irregularis DAOM 181602=DAOM 197198]